jgi:hypothetical protein
MTNADGSVDEMMIPAEIWRRNHKRVTKMVIREKALTSVELDAYHQTADADFSNNHFPRRIHRSRIELYKSESSTNDLMRDMLDKLRERKTGEAGSERQVPLSGTN